MGKISQQDSERVFRAIRGCYAIARLEDFVPEAARALGTLLPFKLFSLVTLDLRTLVVKDVRWEPREMPLAEYSAVYTRYSHQDTVLSHYLSTFDDRLMVASEYIAPEALHCLELYTECMKHFGLEDRSYLEMDRTEETMTTACHAQDRIYTERDKVILRMFMPHLKATYRRLIPARERVSKVEGGQTHKRHSLHATSEGRVLWASPEAYEFICTHGLVKEEAGGSALVLEPRLAEHIRQVHEKFTSTSTLLEWPETTKIASNNSTIEVACLPDARCETFVVVFNASEAFDFASTLVGKGLTKREAEVLYWLTKGKTNEEIGSILSISPKTARLHIEHIFSKLGVENRTAAASAAFDYILHHLDT